MHRTLLCCTVLGTGSPLPLAFGRDERTPTPSHSSNAQQLRPPTASRSWPHTASRHCRFPRPQSLEGGVELYPVKDVNGWTARQIAHRRGFPLCVAALKKGAVSIPQTAFDRGCPSAPRPLFLALSLLCSVLCLSLCTFSRSLARHMRASWVALSCPRSSPVAGPRCPCCCPRSVQNLFDGAGPARVTERCPSLKPPSAAGRLAGRRTHRAEPMMSP